MNIETDDLIIDEGKVFRSTEDEFTKGYIPFQPVIKKEKPWMEFKGGQMDLNTWFQILNFFLWSQEKFKAETQTRLYYNIETRQWASHPMPQTPNGMTTRDEHDDEIRRKFPLPWTYFGTAHHHCTSAAFQSGTDEKNEVNQDGWHFTIGNLDSEELDYHGRFSYNGVLYPAYLTEWIKEPNWAEQIPEEIKWDSIYKYLLNSKLVRSTANPYGNGIFPPEWKDLVKEPPKPTYSGIYQTGYNNQVNFNYEKKTSWETRREDAIVQAEVEVEEILWQAGLGSTQTAEFVDMDHEKILKDPTDPDYQMVQALDLTLTEHQLSWADFRKNFNLAFSGDEMLYT